MAARLTSAFVLLLIVAILGLRGSSGFLRAEDGVVLFNYYNNIDGTLPAFYYAGYISLVPTLVAKAVAGLSMTAQPVVYSGVALLITWLLALKTTAALARRLPLALATAMAGVLMVLVNYSLGFTFLGLIYNIWAMGLICLLVTVDLFDDQPLSWLDAVLVLLFAMSSPTTLALTPFLLLRAWRSDRQRGLVLVLALLILLFYAACIALNPSASTLDLRFGMKAAALAQQLRAQPSLLRDVIVLLGLLAAFVWGVPSLVGGRAAAPARERRIIALVAGYGLGVFLLYALSGRFLSEPLFSSRFLMPGRFGFVFILFLLAGMVLARRTQVATGGPGGRIPGGRMIAIGATAVLGLLVVGYLATGHVRLNVAEAKSRLAFLRDAEQWRTQCAGTQPQVRVFDGQDPWSIAVLCRAQPAPAAKEFHRLREDGLIDEATTETQPPAPSVYIGASPSDAVAFKMHKLGGERP